MAEGSFGFRAAFVLLVLTLAAGLVAAVWLAGRRLGEDSAPTRRRALATALAVALWLAATARLAATGFLAFEPQPTVVPLLALALGGTLFLGFSRFGGRIAAGLPVAVLVGYQSFRIPVELLLHRGYAEGLVPVQLTYLGMNFDVLTGVTALVLAALSQLGPVPRWLLVVWNLVGFGLLANVVAIAALSAPTPLRVFANEPANVWITRAPWIWLPAFLVPMALLGHLLVLRWLLAARGAQGPGATPAVARGGAERGT